MTLFDALTEMLNELESHQLIVVLAPSKRPNCETDMIRVAVDQNPLWYRRFCARHASSRKRPKFDTKIRRHRTLELLHRLLDGRGTRSRYAPEILRIARRRIP